ncbi:MAG: stage sporulation protein [Bacillota bacterium]|nr:stage sporulation protein [Bacillota bacterium]
MTPGREAFMRLCPYPNRTVHRIKGFGRSLRLGRKENILLAAGAFLAGRTNLLGGIAPFGPALFAAFLAESPLMLAVVGLWTLVGLVTALGLESSLPYAFAFTALAFFHYKVLAPPRPAARALALGVALLAARGFTVLVTGGTEYDFGLVAFEAVLAAVTNMIFAHGLPAALGRKGSTVLTNEEVISLGLVTAVALAGTAGLPGGAITPAAVLNRYLVLLLALVGGGGLGAAMGVLAATVGTIAGTAQPESISILGFAGLLAGLLREAGKPGVAAGYLLGDLVLSLYLVPERLAPAYLLSPAAALALFALTPRSWLREVAGLVPGTREQRVRQESYEGHLRRVAGERLADFSQIFAELAASFREVAATARAKEENRLNTLFSTLTAKVCESCNLYRTCWETEFFKTYQNTWNLLALAEAHGGLVKEDIPPGIRRRCRHLPELLTTINYLFDTYRINMHWQKRLEDEREMVSAQLAGMARVIKNLADELKVDVRALEDEAQVIKEELARHELSVETVEVWQNSTGQPEVFLAGLSCPGGRECVTLVTAVLSQALGRPMRVRPLSCSLASGRRECRLKATAAPSYRFVAAGFSRAKKEGDVSGDSFRALELPDGRQALILSDGMGSGTKAAEESQATVRLLEKLLAAGLERDLVLSTLNSILALRSSEERFATLDLALLDPYLGEVEFIKVGACPSLVKRGRTVSVVSPSSPPLGILPSVAPAVTQKRLRAGDVLLMVSDGVLEARGKKAGGIDWLVEYLSRADDEPEELATAVLDLAGRRAGGLADDMTALAVKVEQA